MTPEQIETNTSRFLQTIPQAVEVVAAAKTRTIEEVRAAVRGGIKIIGYNYVQEAEPVYEAIGSSVRWHFIGHLQRYKAKKAVGIFNMIETVDSVRLAMELDKRCSSVDKVMPVLLEVNSGREKNKSGIMPENVLKLAEQISDFNNIRVSGLMTMAPFFDKSENLRPFFRETRILYERLKASGIKNVEMRYLSMGMSDSYLIAIEEGANMIRIGTKLFGERRI
jgi:pyridoxal phosphate enzyme (YggS family)